MILVTGGTGFLGSHLLEQLLKNKEPISAIYRSSSNKNMLEKFPSINWIEGDILDVFFLEDAMQNVDKVYHCAAKISFNPKEEELLERINVDGTSNVVNTALDQNIKKLIHVSSIAALGQKLEHKVIDEEAEWDREIPNSIYSKTKQKAEMQVYRSIAEGLNAAIVCPSVILGKCDWNEGTGKLFQRAWDNPKYYATGTTGFVDVKDVAAAMISLMESDVHSDRFIVNSENLSYKNLFELIAKYLNKKPATKAATPFLSSIAWKAEKLRSFITNKPPMITKDTARTINAIKLYDGSKLLKALPDFNYTPIEKTIQETCMAFLEEVG